MVLIPKQIREEKKERVTVTLMKIAPAPCPVVPGAGPQVQGPAKNCESPVLLVQHILMERLAKRG